MKITRYGKIWVNLNFLTLTVTAKTYWWHEQSQIPPLKRVIFKGFWDLKNIHFLLLLAKI